MKGLRLRFALDEGFSLERLAEINEQQGRQDDALRLYDQILNTNPGYEGVERVKQRVKQLRGE